VGHGFGGRSVVVSARLVAMVLLFIPITLIGVWGALNIPDLVGKESDRILPLTSIC
jgi:hypothetical protein